MAHLAMSPQPLIVMTENKVNMLVYTEPNRLPSVVSGMLEQVSCACSLPTAPVIRMPKMYTMRQMRIHAQTSERMASITPETNSQSSLKIASSRSTRATRRTRKIRSTPKPSRSSAAPSKKSEMMSMSVTPKQTNPKSKMFHATSERGPKKNPHRPTKSRSAISTVKISRKTASTPSMPFLAQGLPSSVSMPTYTAFRRMTNEIAIWK
mmetsp:Transcript_17458/g.52752  ORF Transcript_17458/g.52752 Transcript_17458/m.52752 type:complete len:208 (+) Transcript_17458:693-1316(+)